MGLDKFSGNTTGNLYFRTVLKYVFLANTPNKPMNWVTTAIQTCHKSKGVEF